MIEEKNIIIGSRLRVNAPIEVTPFRQYKSECLKEGEIVTIKNATYSQTIPVLTVTRENQKNYVCSYFYEALKAFDIFELVSEENQSAHDKKTINSENLKKIKKLAEKNKLEEVKNIIIQYPDFLNDKKNVKALLMYSIRSQKTDILNYGFNQNWFEKIEWNDTMATGEIVAAPLYYAFLKGTLEIQQLLVKNGASVENTLNKDNIYTVKKEFEHYSEYQDNLNKLSLLEKIIKERMQLENGISSTKKIEKTIKI